MTGIRSFVAVELPASMREEIRRIEGIIDVQGLRLVRPEIVHVTLKFLGDVPEEKIPRMTKALRKIGYKPFEAKVRGLGAFPGRSVRVVWLGLEGEFEGLYRDIENALKPFGFPREDRKFSPHITIGRVSRPSSEMSNCITSRMADLSDIDLGSFTVDRFYLKKSTLTRGGPIYDNLAEFSLSNPQ